MEYVNIPSREKRYVRERLYDEMNEEQRKIYIKSVRKLVSDLDKLDITVSTEPKSVQPRSRKLGSRKIAFVAMEHVDMRVFSKDSVVKLKEDNYNDRSDYAVKVMLKEGKKWKHVAFVDGGDAVWLRSVDMFQKLPLEWVSSDTTTSKYSIDLRPLEEKGIRVKTKKEALEAMRHKISYD